VVDLKTLKTLSKIDVGDKPDAVIYAQASGRVYVFNGDSKTASVIDPKAAKVVATVELGGSPEFAVEDPEAGRVYNNLEDTSEIVALDEKTNKVVARWPLAPCEEPSGLAIDVAHHRLFAGCGNGVEVAVDSTSGKVVASWKIGQGVDACRFDPSLGLVFASCGEGVVTIAHEDGPDAYSVVQTLATARGARTMTLDPKTHRIYLATAELKPAPEPAPGQPRVRPTVVPGTFKVLVYGPQ
jgi:YVTN family beta-propeller protein